MKHEFWETILENNANFTLLWYALNRIYLRQEWQQLSNMKEGFLPHSPICAHEGQEESRSLQPVKKTRYIISIKAEL